MRLPEQLSRRALLRRALGTAAAGVLWPEPLLAGSSPTPIAAAGPLGDADANGLRLPPGWSARVLATSGQAPVAGNSHRWHRAPYGGGVFKMQDGGWLYVSNSHVPDGGAGALRFDAGGALIDSYTVMRHAYANSDGCRTPWGSWLSSERRLNGRVWEAYPKGEDAHAPELRPVLGRFAHGDVAVDKTYRLLYLTEDAADGRCYRYVCSATDWPEGANRPALLDGVLQVMEIDGVGAGGYAPDSLDVTQPLSVRWVDAASPTEPQQLVRLQLGASAPGSVFRNGAGMALHGGLYYFTTRGDHRIWAFDPAAQTLRCIQASLPSDEVHLTGPDTLTISRAGELLVAESGGDQSLIALLPDGTRKPLLQVVGPQSGTLAGPAFSPDATRLYLSLVGGVLGGGRTYEITIPAS